MVSLDARVLAAIEHSETMARYRQEDCAQYSQAELDPEDLLRTCTAHRELLALQQPDVTRILAKAYEIEGVT